MNKTFLTIISFAVAITGLLLFFVSEKKGPMVDFSLLVLIITIALTLVFSIGNILKDKELLKKTLMGVGVLLALLVVSYLFADNKAVFNAAGDELVSAGSTSKWVGAGIIYSIILLVIGGFMFLWDMIKNTVK